MDSNLEGGRCHPSPNLCICMFYLFVLFCSAVVKSVVQEPGFPGYIWLYFLLSPTLHACPDV